MGEMPQNCNGISLLDCQKEFCRINCEWRCSTAGRLKSTAEPKEKQTNRAKFKNPRQICLIVEKELLDYIKYQAIQLSAKTRFYVSHNELIRETLIKAFPTPKQYDMFGKAM